jgi:hypothetical protein
MRTRRLSSALLAAAALVGMGRSVASASLFLELRTLSVDPAHASAVTMTPDRKSFVIGSPSGAVGATLTMAVVTKVNGADGNQANDGLISVCGSFLSTRGTGGFPRGNLSASRQISIDGLNQTSGFNGTASQDGTQTDLNGDGDLDVGSNFDPDSPGFFAVRGTTAPTPVFGTAPPFDIQVGTLRYVVTNGGSNSTTSINFRKREWFGVALWYEDSVHDPDSNTWSGGHTYNSDPNWTVGSPILVVSIPEPATLGLATLATLPVLIRRRRVEE